MSSLNNISGSNLLDNEELAELKDDVKFIRKEMKVVSCWTKCEIAYMSVCGVLILLTCIFSAAASKK